MFYYYFLINIYYYNLSDFNIKYFRVIFGKNKVIDYSFGLFIVCCLGLFQVCIKNILKIYLREKIDSNVFQMFYWNIFDVGILCM